MRSTVQLPSRTFHKTPSSLACKLSLLVRKRSAGRGYRHTWKVAYPTLTPRGQQVPCYPTPGENVLHLRACHQPSVVVLKRLARMSFPAGWSGTETEPRRSPAAHPHSAIRLCLEAQEFSSLALSPGRRHLASSAARCCQTAPPTQLPRPPLARILRPPRQLSKPCAHHFSCPHIGLPNWLGC